jgi:hypothetical protein
MEETKGKKSLSTKIAVYVLCLIVVIGLLFFGLKLFKGDTTAQQNTISPLNSQDVPGLQDMGGGDGLPPSGEAPPSGGLNEGGAPPGN